jgi:alkylhydroperoxidase family enzyme
MRLGVLRHGHRLRARGFIRLVRLLTGQRLDAVAQMALYRPEFFGRPMFECGSEVLRGPSFWTPAEREFLAVHTSRLNECPFCVRAHTETTRVESGGGLDVDDLHVNLVFNVMNRLANAFDFAWDSDEHVRMSAKVIHRIDTGCLAS